MSKKSNDLDMIPDIKPAKDEVMSYRRNAKRASPRQSNFNGLLVFVLVFMAILMGIGGYALYELQLQLTVSNNLLQRAGDERTRMEEDLAVSGVKSSSAFKKMNDQQQTNISEIRKLWVVAHEQNKPEIKRLGVSNTRLTADLIRLAADLMRTSQKLDGLSSGISGVHQNLADDNADTKTQLSILRGQIQNQADMVEKNNRVMSSLAQKIKNLAEDIGIFDQYRRQTNKKLLDLQNQLRTRVMPAPGTATGGSPHSPVLSKPKASGPTDS